MCGIAGFIGRSRLAGATVERMAEMLCHRGPDGGGVTPISRGWFGHRRLAIVGLGAGGAQPMWDAEERYCITYNGEIYNWRELREEAGRRGALFQSETDTEVVLQMYALDGARSFSRLRGMFAFCLFDSESGNAYLVRDRAGIKPLYVAGADEGLYFASELGPLLGSGAVPFRVDQRSLQSFLRLDYVPSPWSLVENVRKLNGGEILECGPAGVRSYALDPLPVETMDANDGETLTNFEQRIERVVARQLVADVPVGVFLSGGVDSTIIAATAARVCGGIDTFSIAFEEESFDESAYARTVADHIGSRHHEHRVGADGVIGTFADLPIICSEPIADGSILPTLALCRFVRTQVKVALSGDGADELFGGYPLYQIRSAGAVLSRMPKAAVGAMQFAAGKLPVRYENLTTGYKATRFLRGLANSDVLRHHRWLGTFLPPELQALLTFHDPVFDAELDALLTTAVEEHRGLEALMRSDERFYLQDQVLVKADRASMANSLEIRVPFLDEEMVAFAHSLPARLKVRPGQSKVLLRRFLAERFPERIWKRPKKGFGAPIGKWFRGPLRELLHDTLSDSSLQRAGLFNARFVSRLLHEHDQGLADHRKELFNLLTVSLWMEHWRQRSLDAATTGSTPSTGGAL